MINYLLDTNICIFTIKRKPPEIREQFRRHHGQMAISAVTLMELIYGAEKSQAHPTCGSSSGFPDCVSWIGCNEYSGLRPSRFEKHFRVLFCWPIE